MSILRRQWESRAMFLFLISVVAAVAGAQGPPPGPWPGRGGPPAGGFLGAGLVGGYLELLQHEQVRKELELVDDQIEKLKALGEEVRREMREQFAGLRDLSEDQRRERFAELQKKMQQRGQQTNAKLGQILLPHQMERLRQLQLQFRMRLFGTARVLGSDEVSESLHITAAQKEKLEQTARAVEQEVQQKIEKLRQEGRAKLLEVLTAEQRQQLEGMMGKPFELRPEGEREPAPR